MRPLDGALNWGGAPLAATPSIESAVKPAPSIFPKIVKNYSRIIFLYRVECTFNLHVTPESMS